eukprot:1336096-Pyramimonas_sp.AAC.1
MELSEPAWALKRTGEPAAGDQRRRRLIEESGGGGGRQQQLERLVKVLAALALTQAAELRDLIAA